MQLTGLIKARGISLAAALSADPIDEVSIYPCRQCIAESSKPTVKAAQLLMKKGLQAEKTRKGMNAEKDAAADAAAEEEKEERRIAAAEVHAAAALQSAIAQEEMAKTMNRWYSEYKSKYDPAPSQRFVQSHTSCRTETTDEEISALTEEELNSILLQIATNDILLRIAMTGPNKPSC